MSITFFQSSPGSAGQIADQNAYAAAFATEYRVTHTLAHTVTGADLASTSAGGLLGFLLQLPEQPYTERYVYIRLKGFAEGQENTQDVAGFGSAFGTHGKSLNEIIIPITSGGNYDIPPLVQFSAPDTSTLSPASIEAAPIMSGSEVVAVQILNGGAGYTSVPTYSFVRNAADTQTADAVPVQPTSGDMVSTYLDGEDRGTYLRLRLPTEYETPSESNVVPVTSSGTYGSPPLGVEFSPPDLPNGRRAEGRLVLDGSFTVLGLEITYPGRGYLSAPTVTVLRSPGDTETDDAQFEPLQVTQAEYVVVTHIVFDRTDFGQPGSPITAMADSMGTLHTTWISWPSVRQASAYTVLRDGNVIGNVGDIKQLPFEDVYVQTGGPELHSYSVSGEFPLTVTPRGFGCEISFSGEGTRIDGSSPPSLSYLVKASVSKIGEADEQSFLNPYGAAFIPNARRGTEMLLSGSVSPVLHVQRDQLGFENLLQPYRLEYEQWSYLPAAYRATRTRQVSFYIQTAADELVLYRQSGQTGLETQVGSPTPPGRTELPAWLTLDDPAAVGGDTHTLEYVFQSSLIRQFGWDGKWYMMWPSVPGSSGYEISYLDGLTEVPVQTVNGTIFYRDVVEIEPSVTEYGAGTGNPSNELNWNSIRFATGFEVQRRNLNGTDDWQTLAFLTDPLNELDRDGDHPTSYVDQHVKPGEVYAYRIMAGRNPPEGYVVRTRTSPSQTTEQLTDIEVSWSFPHIDGARWQLQRRLTQMQLNADGTAQEVTSTTDYGADGNDDGAVAGDAEHVTGTIPDLREKSEWVDVTDEDQQSSPPYSEMSEGESMSIPLVTSLEYRVIVRFPLHTVSPGNFQTGWASGAVVLPKPVEGEEKHAVYARLKIQDDPYYDWIESVPSTDGAADWVRYYSGELFSRPGQRRGFTRMYPVVTNVVSSASVPEQNVDVFDHSVPATVNYSVTVGPMVANSGGTAPIAKMIMTPVITQTTYTLGWPIAGETYTVTYRTRFGDGGYGPWDSAGVTYDSPSKTVTDTALRITEYSIRYKVKGTTKSDDTVEV